MLALLEPALEVVGRNDHVDCIVCDCRPNITFCGRYDLSEPKDEQITREAACPACYEIWIRDEPCPFCGCRVRFGDGCQLCEVNL